MKIGDKVIQYCSEHNMSMMDFSHMIGADLRTVLHCTCQNPYLLSFYQIGRLFSRRINSDYPLKTAKGLNYIPVNPLQ